MNREEATRRWYEDYHRKRGGDRNDLRANSGTLFQVLAYSASVIRAVAKIPHEPETAKVLDVGCGEAGDFYQLLRLRYVPWNMTGIDVLSERIAAARKAYPQARFICGDASCMDFPDDSFDLVFESTMFATLADDELSTAIAREMLRVCRPGGYLLIVDWRISRSKASGYSAVTKNRLKDLFRVGGTTRLLGTYRGALIPPLGRCLSRWLPSAYFLVSAVCPYLCGQVAYLLVKNVPSASDQPVC